MCSEQGKITRRQGTKKGREEEEEKEKAGEVVEGSILECSRDRKQG